MDSLVSPLIKHKTSLPQLACAKSVVIVDVVLANIQVLKETNMSRFEETIYLYRFYKSRSSIRDFICYRMPPTSFTIFRSWKIPCTMCYWSPCKFFFYTTLLHCRRAEWSANLVQKKNYAKNIVMIKIIDLLQATSEHSAHLVCSYELSMPLQAAKTKG
jgi:hypothetical protein